MPKVVYVAPDGHEYSADVPNGVSVMEGARTNGIPGIDADCGGACACATCHVHVAEEWRLEVGAPSGEEAEMLDCATDPGEDSRLSCQLKMRDSLDGLIVRLPVTQR